MSPTLAEIVDQFADLRVTVIGDVMLDNYTEGVTRRLCQEAPVPVLDVRSQIELPGGAANTAANLASLGASTRLLGVVGQDEPGKRLQLSLEQLGVSTANLVLSHGRSTLLKRRLTCDGHLICRIDEGTTTAVIDSDEDDLIDAICDVAPDSDAIVISDYHYGVLTPRVINALQSLSELYVIPIIVDSKDLRRFSSIEPAAVKPNYEQIQQLLGQRLPPDCQDRASGLTPHGAELLRRTGSKIVAATLDRDGSIIFSRTNAPHRIFAQRSPSTNVAGAGDTFLAAFSLALATGAAPEACGEIASAAAAIVVARNYTATCSQQALRDSLAGTESLQHSLTSILPAVAARRRLGERIVLTNGCFDVLHRGHVAYLQQARNLGDALIVGVNSDDSIRRLKGPERPINHVDDRLNVLAALSCVDHLVVFNEDTPHALIQALQPDVFVKGGDYTRETLPEAELVEQLGGVVKILPFLDGRSTTKLISKIRLNEREGTDAVTFVGGLSN